MKIWRDICLSHFPVNGYFKYEDKFQIIPPLKEWPTEKFAPYPFMLQIAYDNSEWWEKYVTLRRILNLLIVPGVKDAARNGIQAWASFHPSTGGHYTPEYVQTGYLIDGFVWAGEGFDDISALHPITFCPDNEYYGPISKQFGTREFILPEGLTNRLTSIERLKKDPSLYKKFFMACTWFEMSGEISQHQSSLRVAALVTCIECLLDHNSKKCAQCHQDIYNTTRKFNDFIKQYTQYSGEVDKLFKKIYPIRSDIDHGIWLSSMELTPWLFPDLQENPDIEDIFIELGNIVRIAIINWLDSVTSSAV